MTTKMFFTTMIVFALYANSFGQMTTRQVAEKKEGDATSAFDSLSGTVNAQNYKQVANQQVYILPKSKSYKNKKETDFLGYTGFAAKAEALSGQPSGVKDRVYKPVLFYKHPQTGAATYVSDYKALAGKYFTLLEVLDHTDYRSAEAGVFAKLQNKENGDVVYYLIAPSLNYLQQNRPWAPFIFVGYFEKMKQQSISKRFILKKDLQDVNDINTGKPVSCLQNSEWVCTDVALIEDAADSHAKLVFVLKNTAGEEIGMPEGDKSGWKSIKDFKNEGEVAKENQEAARKLEEQKALEQKRAANEAANAAEAKARKETLIKKYGTKNGTAIADGKVYLGMSKAMCTESWGEPTEVNKTTGGSGVYEQWVYGIGRYLYFDNGVLTTIQD